MQFESYTVGLVVHGDDQLLRQSMMMDPLVGAVCNPNEVWQMVDKMALDREEANRGGGRGALG